MGSNKSLWDSVHPSSVASPITSLVLPDAGPEPGVWSVSVGSQARAVPSAALEFPAQVHEFGDV